MHAFLYWKDQFVHALLTPRQHIPLYVALGVGLLVLILVIRSFARREQPSMSLAPSSFAPITSMEIGPSRRCTHCNAGMASRQDFCPACGYAQPVRQTGTAARFPG